MTDYIWPDDLVPYVMSYYLQPHTGRSVSPMTRQQKTYELSAPRWLCRMSFRGGYQGKRGVDAYGPRLDAFITMLRGGVNRVAIYDFRRPKLRGINTGWTLTNAPAASGATSMTVGGFSPHGLAFHPGDMIGGDGRAHIVQGLSKQYADDAGEVVVPIWPPLASAIAEGAAVYGNPTSWFRLLDDDAGANPTPAGDLAGYDLDFAEDL